MKRILTALIFSLLTLSATAQTQREQVVIIETPAELNEDCSIKREGEPISGVIVRISNGNTHESDTVGRLSFYVDYKARYSATKVAKEDYELISTDIITPGRSYTNSPSYVLMQKSSKLIEAELAEEKRQNTNIKAELKKRDGQIEELKRQNQISEKEAEAKRIELYNNYTKAMNNLRESAREKVRLDYARMSDFDRQFEGLLRANKLESADSLLATKGDMERRKREIADLRIDEFTSRSLVDSLVQSLGGDMYKKHEIASRSLKNKEAAHWLEERAKLDPENVEWQMDAAKYIQDYLADYEKALEIYYGVLNDKRIKSSLSPSILATLYDNIGDIYQIKNEYDLAHEYIAKGLDLREDCLEPNHPDIALSYNHLGELLTSRNRFNEALDIFSKGLDICKATQWEHENTANILLGLGVVYYSIDRFTESKQCILQACEIIETLFNKNDYRMAEGYKYLAFCYMDTQDFELAEEYLQKALKLHREVLGAEHPYSIESNIILASLYYAKDDYRSAYAIIQEELVRSEKLFGQTHSYTAACHSALLAYYLQIDNYVAAEKECEILMRIAKELDDITYEPHDKMGEIYAARGNYTEALKHFQEDRHIQERIYGPNTTNAALSYTSLAECYCFMDDYDTATDYCNKALAIYRVCGKEYSLQCARIYALLAMLCQGKLHIEDALDFADKCLAIRKDILGNEHTLIADTYAIMSNIYIAIDKTDEALNYLQKAKTIYLNTCNENSILVANCYNVFGDIFTKIGKNDKALDYYTKSQVIYDSLLGQNSSYAACVYEGLGWLYYCMMDYGTATKYYNEALKLYNELLGSNSLSVANIYNQLGIIYADQGFNNYALGYYKKALDIYVKTKGDSHIGTINIRNNIGEICVKCKEYNEAYGYFNEYLNRSIEVFGKKHSSVAKAYANIATTYQCQNEYKKAIKYYQKSAKIWQKLPSQQKQVAVCYDLVAQCYIELKYFKAATDSYFDALETLNQAFDSDLADAIVSHLAGVCYAVVEEAEFEQYVDYITTRCAKQFGEDHPYLARMNFYIGDIFYKLSDYSRAIDLYTKATADEDLIKDSKYINIGVVHYLIGQCYHKLKEYNKALLCYKKALEVYEAVSPTDEGSITSLKDCINYTELLCTQE